MVLSRAEKSLVDLQGTPRDVISRLPYGAAVLLRISICHSQVKEGNLRQLALARIRAFFISPSWEGVTTFSLPLCPRAEALKGWSLDGQQHPRT